MALTGCHVAFGFIGAEIDGQPGTIYGELKASDTITLPGTSAVSAPSTKPGSQRMMVRITPSVDVWYSIGPSPADPSLNTTTRDIAFANTPLDRVVQPGDKVRVVAA